MEVTSPHDNIIIKLITHKKEKVGITDKYFEKTLDGEGRPWPKC
jgi:hypothetical protein